MALITLSWTRLTWPALAVRHAASKSRKMSATSRAGQVMIARALAPDRPDQPFNISVLPGRSERGGPAADAHCSHAILERNAKCSVIVANQIFRCPVPRKRFGDLPCQPLGRRIAGDRKPQQ